MHEWSLKVGGAGRQRLRAQVLPVSEGPRGNSVEGLPKLEPEGVMLGPA